MLRVTLLLSMTLPLLGCQGLMQAMHQDPFRNIVIKYSTKKDDDLATALSLDASRRIILVSMQGEHAGKFCAEPPPDTANATETAFRLALSAKASAAERAGEGTIGADESTRLAPVTIVSSRAPAIEMYRTGVFALCNYFLAGAIKPPDIKDQFEKLTKLTADNLQAEVKTIGSSHPAAGLEAARSAQASPKPGPQPPAQPASPTEPTRPATPATSAAPAEKSKPSGEPAAAKGEKSAEKPRK